MSEDTRRPPTLREWVAIIVMTIVVVVLFASLTLTSLDAPFGLGLR